MMLHIDIETYSPIDIAKSGAYKYFESPEFQILLMAYNVDGLETHIIDLASGEKFPEWLKKAIENPNVIKAAHNANFERNAFRAIGLNTEAGQWECSAVKAAYCGLPMSLAEVSKALELEEKGKLATGKALIKYFCCPVKPTASNGMRTRNMPHHDTVKWSDFKEYCMQDVEAEMAVLSALKAYEIPSLERELYNLDQAINDKGILLDEDLAQAAFDIDNENADAVCAKIQALTGIDNANSAAQLKQWLGEAMDEDITTLAKGVIPDLLKRAGAGVAGEVLELRAHASKTSTKKYAAMLNCVGEGSRIRGLFQFYGANRTGRWAGRLVQLQNLPQNKIKNIDDARAVLKMHDYDTFADLFPRVADTLSQLVRTAFVAPEGQTLLIADFSAIEARVIAWLAIEQWRLEVFATHGKIYEASASMMFGIPLEQITKGSELRTKGKIAELALGYQGSVGALKKMGGESMGLSEQEMADIVSKWRKANKAIVQLWNDVEAAAIQATKRHGAPVVLQHFRGLEFFHDGAALSIELPSGRKLFYRSASIAINKFAKPSVRYKGLDQATKKWWWVDSYGGKFVENIVQAIARDLLGHSMLTIAKQGFSICMHVHDEVVCEHDAANAQVALDVMCDSMSENVPWAPGLVLKVEGYHSKFYKKD
jgi:DNA polymerase